MSELFRIADVDPGAIAARAEALRARVSAIVPSARVELVGASAVPGLPGKGDVDVQVRVPREAFASAVAALSTTFARNPGGYDGDDGVSFSAGADGIHVTVIGGAADEPWVLRDMLIEDAALREDFAALRRACDGRPMDAWRIEKGRFYERMKARPRFAASRALAAFPIKVDLVVQWGDQDAYGHVNNVVYLKWMESARMAYFAAVDFTSNAGVGPILASASCRYKAPLHHPDVVTAAARVVDVQDDRFAMELAIWSRALGCIAATGDAVMVAYDYATSKKAKLPEHVRARIEALERR